MRDFLNMVGDLVGTTVDENGIPTNGKWFEIREWYTSIVGLEASTQDAASAGTVSKDAAQAAQTASESARDESISAKNASESARDAALSSENTATTAKNASESARDESISAKNASESARDESISAKNASESARDAALSSKNTATTAKNASESASSVAVVAKNMTLAAKVAALAAETSSENSRAASEAIKNNVMSLESSAAQKVNQITNLSASAVSLVSSESAYVSYNSTTGVLTVGIPQGLPGDRGEAFVVNAVGILAEKSGYDNQNKNFSYNATDSGEIYFKLSDASGDWSAGAPFGKGDKGNQGESMNIRVGVGNILQWQYPSEGATWHNLVDLDVIYDSKFLRIDGVAFNSLKLSGIQASLYYHTGNKPTANDVGAISTSAVENNLLSSSITNVLAAAQGKILKALIDNLSALVLSDDATLDDLQEIVNFIKQNKSSLDALSINNIAGLQSALASKVDAARVLSDVPLNAVFIDTVYSLPSSVVHATEKQALHDDALRINGYRVYLYKGDGTSESVLIPHTAVQNVLNSTSTVDALSANQGRILKSFVDSKIEAADYASSTVGGTIKMRVDGSTLHITNNGSTA